MSIHSSFTYIQSKMEHMKRMGLVSKPSTRGKHGGACPDWLRREQEEEKKARDKGRMRRLVASYLSHQIEVDETIDETVSEIDENEPST